jgi:hypothetical protein
MNLAAAILSGVRARIARNIVQISGCTDGVFAEELTDRLPVMEGRESTELCAVLLHSVWTRGLRAVSSAEPREEESP